MSTLILLGIRENEIKILSGFLSPFIKIKKTSSSSYFLTWLTLKGCYLLSLLHFLAPFDTTDGVGHLENLGLREIVLQRFQPFLPGLTEMVVLWCPIKLYHILLFNIYRKTLGRLFGTYLELWNGVPLLCLCHPALLLLLFNSTGAISTLQHLSLIMGRMKENKIK